MNFIPILRASMLALILGGFARGSEIEFYRANGYQQRPIPREWRPAKSGGSISDIREIPATFRPSGSSYRDFTIRGFIARHGMPDQYWVRTSRKRGWDFLVYNRADGTIVMYVPEAPGTNFGAVAIWDRTGKLLDLVK